MELAHLGYKFWDFGIINDLEISSVNNDVYNLYLATNNNAVAFLYEILKITSLITH